MPSGILALDVQDNDLNSLKINYKLVILVL